VSFPLLDKPTTTMQGMKIVVLMEYLYLIKHNNRKPAGML